MRTETIAIHGGCFKDRNARALAVPIYETVAYEFESAEHAAALFDLRVEGHRYSRISNPTTAVLEQRVALLEGGIAALAVSSGQAALHYAFLNLAKTGANIVTTPELYGTTYSLLVNVLPLLGLQPRVAPSGAAEDIKRLIDDHTCAVFCETVSNPSNMICDIEAVAAAAHGFGVPLLVDNTMATPFLVRPIDFGADIVIHSLTKFLGGHGRTLGGAIVDSGNFDWRKNKRRFPMFNEPDPSYHDITYVDRFGNEAYLARCRSVFLRTTGSTLSAISAFQLLQGIESAPARIDRHIANARRIATFLRDNPRVRWTNYVGFNTGRSYNDAVKYLGGRGTSVFSFGLHGGFEAAKRFYDSLRLIKRVVNFGDVRSMACHPSSTTHRQLTAEQQLAAGIAPEMIRLSVGLENVEDITDDLRQALTATYAGADFGEVLAPV